MPGFFVSSQHLELELKNRYPERCVSESMTSQGFTAERNTLNKFMQDKAFSETDEAVMIADGVLLNKADLFEKYRAESVADLMWSMYQKEGEMFFCDFRGPFSGALYDKKNDKWLVYTNHIGDAAVFYADLDGVFYAGSQVNYIIDALRKQNIRLAFDEQAAYQMLTFGFMEGNSTYAKEIKRLRGGTYLRAEKGKAEVLEYHMFRKHPERFRGKSEGEIIDALDKAFRRASEMEYAKDDEYGCEHLVDISGGLDSRMNMWVAHTMRRRHLHLMTYSKADYLDEKIAKEIAGYWNDELLVKPLNDASYLYEIDEITFLNGGLSLYSAITGGKRMLERIRMDTFGLEHTGMIGDVVIGAWYKELNNGQRKLPTGKYSEKLSYRLENKESVLKFGKMDHEIYLFYTRGFQGAANTHLIRKNYLEVVSTFLDVDLLQLCIDISVENRIGHALYKKWILKKYPEAGKFRWEKTGGKITEPLLITKVRRIVKKGPLKLLRMLGKSQYINTGMNPLDYWIAHNDPLREYMDAYEREGYRSMPSEASAQLIEDMKQLYSTGNANEKTMVLTVLASAKLYFGDIDETN